MSVVEVVWHSEESIFVSNQSVNSLIFKPSHYFLFAILPKNVVCLIIEENHIKVFINFRFYVFNVLSLVPDRANIGCVKFHDVTVPVVLSFGYYDTIITGLIKPHSDSQF